MKKILLIMLLIITISLTSCEKKQKDAPTCTELIETYQQAGYNVLHSDDVENYLCYVKVWLDDEYDYAYFYFFDSEENAKKYLETRDYNILIYMFSIIYGDPQWLHTKSYQNIEYEYVNLKLIKPFKQLIK